MLADLTTKAVEALRLVSLRAALRSERLECGDLVLLFDTAGEEGC